MAKKIVVLLQDVIGKGCFSLPNSVCGMELEVIQFSHKHGSVRDRLQEIDSGLTQRHQDGEVAGAICFVSINVAAVIQRCCDGLLRSGLFLGDHHDMHDARHFMHWHNFANEIPSQWMLNPKGEVFSISGQPFPLPQVAPDSSLFVRPLSGWKSFAGFVVSGAALAEEMAFRSTFVDISKGDLCLAAPAQDIDQVEWRVHMISGTPVSYAPYSWYLVEGLNAEEPPHLPEAVAELAVAVGERLVWRDNYVLDICLTAAGARVVEVNAVSTAGWYHNTDVEGLITSIVDFFY